MANSPCLNGLTTQLRRLQQSKSEKDCLELAEEIYKYLETHPNSVMRKRKITIIIPRRVEAKKSGEE